MKWPWHHHHDPPPAADRSEGDARADVVQRRLSDRQRRVDELEQWARRERRLNSFSERMRRGMGGGG